MTRKFAFVVLTIVAATMPAAAVADPGFLCSDSLKINFPEPKGPGDPYFSAQIVEMVRFNDLLRHGPIEPGVDFGVMTPEDQVRFYRDYCIAHPSNTYQDATMALYNHMAELTAAEAVHSSARLVPDFEAPADVRAYVLAQALPSQMGKVIQPVDAVPEAFRTPDVMYYSRLAREKSGRILVVPDATSLAYGIGDLSPDFGLHPVVLATVFPRNWVHDKPPSGNEDKPARTGIPAFYVGTFGRDVWEIGQSKGVLSVRLDSEDDVGPWEPFQSDPMKYVYYGQHFLNGRTAEQNFSDPKVAALTLAACAGNEAAIARALKDGADPNGKGKDGDTPIFWALDCENPTGLEALLKAGADPNYRLPPKIIERFTWTGAREPPGQTITYSATYWAALMHKADMLKLLLKYGGDPNAH